MRFLALLLVSCLAAPVLSQDQTDDTSQSSKSSDSLSLLLQDPKNQPDYRERPTLPEIEVRPPEGTASESETDPSTSSGMDLLPPIGLDSPSDLSSLGGTIGGSSGGGGDNPFRSSAIPDLLELQFGQSGRFGAQTGIFRSSQSIFDTAAAASIRTQEEIRERQSADMFQALQNEVGVLIQSTAAGQASPFIRGLTGQQVLILIDGIRLNNSTFRRGPNQYFNTIDPGMVDHIEVLRGQGSVLWGSDAIGGTINVVTRSADSHWGLCHGDYCLGEFTQYYNTSNSSPYSRLNVEGWVGAMGMFGGGSFLNVRDLDTGFDQFPRQPGTNYQQYAGDIKFNVLVSENSMLTLAMQHLKQEDLPRSDRFPGYPFDRNNSNTPGGARFFDPQQRDLIYLRYQSIAPCGGMFDAATFTASYQRQFEKQTRGMPTTRFQETDVETTGLQWVVSRDCFEFGDWTSGFDWYYDDVDSSFGGTASGPIIPDDAWYRRAGWFLNGNIPLTCRIDATAGVRYESIETAGTPIIDDSPQHIKTSYDDWVSQVGLIFKCSRDVNTFVSISQGFRAPNLDDLMANNPNVLQQGQSVPSLGLRPENSINYELGLKTNFDRLRTQSSVFWLDLDDNIVSITAAPNTFASANQDSLVQGCEFSGEYLLDRCWDLYGNFWYTRGENNVTDAPLSRVPPAQGILGLRYREPCGHRFFTIYTWMSDRQDRLDPVRDVTDERIPIGGTPGFATLNLRMGRTLGQDHRHRLSLSLENLLDKDYLIHGSGVLGTGATARFGYNAEF